MPSIQRIRATVRYDGTFFHGFQRQQRQRTVQQALEEAIMLAGSPVSVIPAGRTDTGVHARGQVVHFDYSGTVPPDNLCRFLNDHLPQDVAVDSVTIVPATFHARRSAISRTYRYYLFTALVRDPLRERFAWRLSKPLDFAHLHAAIQALQGVHDFRRFGTIPGNVQQQARDRLIRGWRREIYAASIVRERSCIAITLEADAFLTHMARALVGAVVAVSQSQLPLNRLVEALADDQSDTAVAPLAPPHGLIFWSVRYAAAPLDESPSHHG
ncbi:MAG: tRNA pseudouridine(38-40) synthase TruA [Chloroflexi bacterium]|nr:tRNA pseudouridine(38-40) synthase TruA [Chloroflexota bacterium]